MKSKPGFLAALALALVLSLTATSFADDIHGKMQAVLADNTTFIMKDNAGTEHTFQLAENAYLELNGEIRPLTDFREGDVISVKWVERDGQRFATEVWCER